MIFLLFPGWFLMESQDECLYEILDEFLKESFGNMLLYQILDKPRFILEKPQKKSDGIPGIISKGSHEKFNKEFMQECLKESWRNS